MQLIQASDITAQTFEYMENYIEASLNSPYH